MARRGSRRRSPIASGEILAENESDLLGADAPGEVKRRFVAMVNDCAVDCAGFDWPDEGPDYAFLRYLGHRVADVMEQQDKTWAVSQVIEVEAPEAAETLQRGMAGLLGTDAGPAGAGRACATGE